MIVVRASSSGPGDLGPSGNPYSAPHTLSTTLSSSAVSLVLGMGRTSWLLA